MVTPSKVFQVSDTDPLLHILDASYDLSSLDDSASDSADIGYLQNVDTLESDTDQASSGAPNDNICNGPLTAKYEADFDLPATHAYESF